MFVRQTLQSCLYMMRNVMLAGLAAVITIFVVWSMSTFAKPKLVGKQTHQRRSGRMRS
jgi:hypothetical protein